MCCFILAAMLVIAVVVGARSWREAREIERDLETYYYKKRHREEV